MRAGARKGSHIRRAIEGEDRRRTGLIARVCVLVAVSAALCVAAAVLPRAAAAAPALAPNPAPTAAWTVMVYMDGDQNPGDLYLGSWLTHDIDKEIAAVGSDADVQVVVLADRGRYPSAADGSWTGARVFHVTKGMTATAANAAADWGPTDMGSPQTLVDFVDWARTNYPARHYALFLWDHGWGWWPDNTMEDDTSNDYLDMDELRDALEAVHGVDMVGWDTCLSQTIEVEAQLRGFADAMAGSQDSIGYSGFSYQNILSALQGSPAMSPAALAVVAARSMKTGHDRWTWAASAVSLGRRWDALTTAVSYLGWDLAVRLRDYHRAYAVARRRAASPPQTYPEDRDLYDVAMELRSHVASPAIKRDCTRVLKLERKVVLWQWHVKAEGPVHGIDIFWPSSPAPPQKGSSFEQWMDFPYYCADLNFTRLTDWGDFLTAWGK
ncbi:MAG: clostripain-related cysteine peptidase [Thermoleophilia bacterium]